MVLRTKPARKEHTRQLPSSRGSERVHRCLQRSLLLMRSSLFIACITVDMIVVLQSVVYCRCHRLCLQLVCSVLCTEGNHRRPQVMRFTAKWDSQRPEEYCRTFIISFYPADDTLSIWETSGNGRNTGMASGKFCQCPKILSCPTKHHVLLFPLCLASDAHNSFTLKLLAFFARSTSLVL